MPKRKQQEISSQAAESNPVVKKSAEVTMSGYIDAKQTSQFTSHDFEYLARNENGRYKKNGRVIGHAVINNKIAKQYSLFEEATSVADNVPKPSILQEIEEFQPPLGNVHFQAKGPQGERLVAKRFNRFLYDGQLHQVAYFSEPESDLDDDLDDTKETTASLPSMSLPVSQKGGHILKLDVDSIRARDTNKTRVISQNQVMGPNLPKGLSARDVYEQYFKQYEDQLSPEMAGMLSRAFRANIHVAPENQYRPEWLHAYGFSLFPKDQNPQVKENLGAASKWVNTEMMIIERLAKWFALNLKDEGQVTIKAIFDMLNNSELIAKIQYEVSIDFRSKFIQFIEELNTFKTFPVFRKATDLAQAIAITHALLEDKPAASTSEIQTIDSRQYLENQQSKYVAIVNDFPLYDGKCEHAKIFTIMDTETTDLNVEKGQLIEMTLISFAFTEDGQILGLVGRYFGQQDPQCALNPDIVRLTKRTNAMLKNKEIDWSAVEAILRQSDYVFCHNSQFDRTFLEAHAPQQLRALIQNLAFGCTMQDIDWQQRGIESKSLKKINAHFGFRYVAHDSSNDCWAVLNLLHRIDGALKELLENIKRPKTLICAKNTEFEKKDLLKARHYRWHHQHKCWYSLIRQETFEAEKQWLQHEIYDGKTESPDIVHSTQEITAKEAYSERLWHHLSSKTLLIASKEKATTSLLSKNSHFKARKKPKKDDDADYLPSP